MEPIKIWDKFIGDGHRPYFVAELGTCHRGSMKIAKENAEAAVNAGADCIKTELFYETEVFHRSAIKVFKTRTENFEVPLIEHMRKYQFTLDEHHEIKKFCDELSVPFMATAHDQKRVDFLVDIGAVAVKIASPDIVFYPLITYAARSGLVIFIDTGGAYQYEIEMAVKVARDAGCEQIIVNHSPDGHPSPATKHNLRAINHLKKILEIPIGFADHFDGYEMLYASIIAGANTVEKPISENRFIEECEHIWAISRDDLKEVISKMNIFYDSLGEKHRQMELGLRPENPNRVALIANKDIFEGDEINLDNITFGKPRLGIGVEFWDNIVGKSLSKFKKKGTYIQWDDIK